MLEFKPLRGSSIGKFHHGLQSKACKQNVPTRLPMEPLQEKRTPATDARILRAMRLTKDTAKEKNEIE